MKQIPIFIAVVLIVMAVRSTLIEPFRIPSGSMLPTLISGDLIFVNKAAYGTRLPFSDWVLSEPLWMSKPKVPHVGDIVVFVTPEEKSTVLSIKRVVGLPGDRVKTVGKEVWINGEALARQPLEEAEEARMLAQDGFDSDNRYNEQKLQLSYEQNRDHKYMVLEDDAFEGRKDSAEIVLGPDQIYLVGDNRDDTRDSRDFGPVPTKNLRGRASVVWLSYRVSLREGASFVRWDRIGKAIR
jgi:signal peptidase I